MVCFATKTDYLDSTVSAQIEKMKDKMPTRGLR